MYREKSKIRIDLIKVLMIYGFVYLGIVLSINAW